MQNEQINALIGPLNISTSKTAVSSSLKPILMIKIWPANETFSKEPVAPTLTECYDNLIFEDKLIKFDRMST